MLEWFRNIPPKKHCKFVQLDIVEFYPSISHELLTNAIQFAKNITEISDQTYETIMHAQKALLFDKDAIWTKKGESLFDVTMGSYDGAEICELVGLFLLHEIETKFKDLKLGLYRDDGLGITRGMPGPKQERMNKEIIKLFKSHGLKITIQGNLQQVNFLDVTLDLRNGKFWPFRKPNDVPLYIHKHSNHPPSIIKQLPAMIESRISSISHDEEEFNKAKDEYNTALKKSGFNCNIKFNKQTYNKAPHRQRRVIWFHKQKNG